jgi:hypothetical protein
MAGSNRWYRWMDAASRSRTVTGRERAWEAASVGQLFWRANSVAETTCGRRLRSLACSASLRLLRRPSSCGARRHAVAAVRCMAARIVRDPGYRGFACRRTAIDRRAASFDRRPERDSGHTHPAGAAAFELPRSGLVENPLHDGNAYGSGAARARPTPTPATRRAAAATSNHDVMSVSSS